MYIYMICIFKCLQSYLVKKCYLKKTCIHSLYFVKESCLESKSWVFFLQFFLLFSPPAVWYSFRTIAYTVANLMLCRILQDTGEQSPFSWIEIDNVGFWVFGCNSQFLSFIHMIFITKRPSFYLLFGGGKFFFFVYLWRGM